MTGAARFVVQLRTSLRARGGGTRCTNRKEHPCIDPRRHSETHAAAAREGPFINADPFQRQRITATRRPRRLQRWLRGDVGGDLPNRLRHMVGDGFAPRSRPIGRSLGNVSRERRSPQSAPVTARSTLSGCGFTPQCGALPTFARFNSATRLSLSAPTSRTDKAIATGPFLPRTAGRSAACPDWNASGRQDAGRPHIRSLGSSSCRRPMAWPSSWAITLCKTLGNVSGIARPFLIPTTVLWPPRTANEMKLASDSTTSRSPGNASRLAGKVARQKWCRACSERSRISRSGTVPATIVIAPRRKGLPSSAKVWTDFQKAKPPRVRPGCAGRRATPRWSTPAPSSTPRYQTAPQRAAPEPRSGDRKQPKHAPHPSALHDSTRRTAGSAGVKGARQYQPVGPINASGSAVVVAFHAHRLLLILHHDIARAMHRHYLSHTPASHATIDPMRRSAREHPLIPFDLAGAGDET